MNYIILQAILAVFSVSTVKSLTVEELYEESEQARIPTIMAFGKHKGAKITAVPRDYAQWYKRQIDTDPYLLEAFRRAGLLF